MEIQKRILITSKNKHVKQKIKKKSKGPARTLEKKFRDQYPKSSFKGGTKNTETTLKGYTYIIEKSKVKNTFLQSKSYA